FRRVLFRSADRLGRFLLLTPEEEDLTDTLGLLLRRVVDLRVVVQRSRVHADVAELADERIGEGLEDECRELVRRIGLARDFLSRRRPPDHRSRFGGRGEHLADRVRSAAYPTCLCADVATTGMTFPSRTAAWSASRSEEHTSAL